MEAKKYLNQIKVLDTKAKNKRLEVYEIYNQMTGLKGISYESKANTTGDNKSSQERLIHKYLAYQEELQSVTEDLIKAKKEAMNLIDKLDKAEYVGVLYKRYIHFMKWEQIAVDMNCAYRSVLRLHGQALQEFEKLLQVGTKCHI